MIKFSKLSNVTMMVGLPGSGKTTFAASLVKQAIKYNKKHPKNEINIFSNVPIFGAKEFSWKTDFGTYDMSNSIIILDESGLELDNRSWETNFKKNQVQALKLIRHYQSKLIVFSQTWNDTDIKIRSMVSKLFIVRPSIIPFCSVAIPIWRRIDVDEDTHEFKELYYKDSLFFRLFSCCRIVRPFYYKMFDSWECPPLPSKKFNIYEKGV